MASEPVHNMLVNARERLLSERVAEGHWEGKLSTSALSTATAVLALHVVDPEAHAGIIEAGVAWLVKNQNTDGGWGDTVESRSNISTTLLCRAAVRRWHKAVKHDDGPQPDRGKLMKRANEKLNRAGSWVRQNIGGESHEALVEAVKARYGKDRTFSVPILMACVLGGLLDKNEKRAWQRVLPLPFELAAFPQKFFAILQLPVVSYALPALIAIGYARYFHVPPSKPLAAIRKRAWKIASPLLERIQPEGGGFLEATPLTSFVTMALASTDQMDHPVVKHSVAFLLASVRKSGSWPIDTNLATWTTSLAVKALVPPQNTAGEESEIDSPFDSAAAVRRWLLDQQYQEVHPYTAAAPGGWAWTDLPGGVPDADDTPGTLIALRRLADKHSFVECREAAARGFLWLCNLQNRDGGIPTFCRGWGALPFDRSSADLSAHVIRACHEWVEDLPPLVRARVRWMKRRAHIFLRRTRRDDGSWLPLWFGNQHVRNDLNPTYGTAKVALALALSDPYHLLPDALDWLRRHQNQDGGWGGGKDSPSSIEETALAIDAIASGCRSLNHRSTELSDWLAVLERGVEWLGVATGDGHAFPPAPIGFYFAKLWYFEKLYPQVWTVSALESLLALQRSVESSRPLS